MNEANTIVFSPIEIGRFPYLLDKGRDVHGRFILA
jgi:hypothetical protein